ncbi:hypothetical protein NE237_003129 [Protea cynaroides]|uniref:Uncharacterized protein n=1 Tax=Protea cynaroides TaxID=273540 RepID=A0A9Q0QS54_9MAGN|nr:hypothetical protein NE237_003129 [Protea cynaroides]
MGDGCWVRVGDRWAGNAGVQTDGQGAAGRDVGDGWAGSTGVRTDGGCWRVDRWAGGARCEFGTDGQGALACGQMGRDVLDASWGQMGRERRRANKWAGGASWG